jgi:hypothetical protein
MHSKHRREDQQRRRRIKLEDEEAELAEIQLQLAEEKRQEEERKAQVAAEQAQVRQQNDERTATKRAALMKEQAEDRALMAETLRTLEKQEQDRIQAMNDFYVRPDPRYYISLRLRSR